MQYLADIQRYQNDPAGLEALYQAARRGQAEAAFAADLFALRESTPDNLLFAAWFYRLNESAARPADSRTTANWRLAIPLGLAAGLIFWLLSGDELLLIDRIPALMLFFAPVEAAAIVLYHAVSRKSRISRAVWAGLPLLALAGYVLLILPVQRSFLQGPYLDLAVMHVALLGWIAAGWGILGARAGSQGRMAFILKSFEILVTAGLFAIAGGIFMGVTVGMFTTLNVEIPEVVIRLAICTGLGLIPLIAVALVYDPRLEPLEQSFGQGVSRLMPALVRLLLPATVVVLLIYLAFVPFNFRAPFNNRDVLIANNGMLFALMGLLMAASPLRIEDIPDRLRPWMRRGILAVAVLAALIGVYILGAVVSRAAASVTMNRLTVMGWNVANLAILITLIVRQVRARAGDWAGGLHSTFGFGSVLYLAWALFVVLALPLLFR
jgi:hypothetical protein